MRPKTPVIEDDFLFNIYQALEETWEVYPKVKFIPKGKRINPDIDLLVIDREIQSTEGFEIKVVKKTDPFQYFYLGLGEALCYYRHGVDKAFLLLGFFDIPSEKAIRLKRFKKPMNF